MESRRSGRHGLSTARQGRRTSRQEAKLVWSLVHGRRYSTAQRARAWGLSGRRVATCSTWTLVEGNEGSCSRQTLSVRWPKAAARNEVCISVEPRCIKAKLFTRTRCAWCPHRRAAADAASSEHCSTRTGSAHGLTRALTVTTVLTAGQRAFQLQAAPVWHTLTVSTCQPGTWPCRAVDRRTTAVIDKSNDQRTGARGPAERHLGRRLDCRRDARSSSCAARLFRDARSTLAVGLARWTGTGTQRSERSGREGLGAREAWVAQSPRAWHRSEPSGTIASALNFRVRARALPLSAPAAIYLKRRGALDQSRGSFGRDWGRCRRGPPTPPANRLCPDPICDCLADAVYAAGTQRSLQPTAYSARTALFAAPTNDRCSSRSTSSCPSHQPCPGP